MHTSVRRLLSVTTATQRTAYTYENNRIKTLSVTNLSDQGQPGQTLATTYSYQYIDASGIPGSMTIDGPVAGSGDATTLVYNRLGDVAQRTDATGTVTYAGHNGLGLPAQITDADGVLSTVQYDPRGRITAVSRNGATQTFGNDVFGQSTQVRAPDGSTQDYAYDAANRLVRVDAWEYYPSRAIDSLTDMKLPTCPHCRAKPGATFFKPHFQWPTCGTQLSSDLRMVSFVEWAVGVVPVMLIVAALKRADVFVDGSFAQVLLLLLVPVGVVHWAVLCRYLKLRAEP